jgi:hypothetical protein
MKVNKFWLITITYCLLPIAFALSLSLFIRRLPDIGQPESNQFQWIYSGHPVSQTITPQHNGLNVITTYLKNVSIRNQEPFTFELRDRTGIIRTINLTGYNIGDGDNVRFQFPPIMNSANLTLTLTLTSNSQKVSAIGVGYSESAQSIAYQTFYFPTSRILILKSVINNFVYGLANLCFIILFFGLGFLSCLFAKNTFNRSNSIL